MHNPKSIVYDDPRLEPILKGTYGVIVYQEQVQQICRALAGFSYGQADIIRKVIGKKQLDKIEEQKRLFIYGDESQNIKGCVNNGLTEELAESIWAKMEEFAKYAFNKSHAVSYANVSFQTAYLRYYYQEEYMAAFLGSLIGNVEKLQHYINICSKKMGIHVLPPSVNISDNTFTVDDDKNIVFGLQGIKNVGKTSFDIISEREKNGPFKDIFDFIERVTGLTKLKYEALAKSGALDEFGYNRSELIASREELFSAIKKLPKNQVTLFDLIGDSDKYKYPKILPRPEYHKNTIMNDEHEYLGLYISCNPLTGYEEILESCGVTSILDIDDNINNGTFTGNNNKIILGGFLSKVNKKITKNGDPFAFVTIQDMTGQSEGIAWSNALNKSPELYVEGQNPVLVKATVKVDDGGSYSLFIDELISVPSEESEQKEFVRKYGVKKTSGRQKKTDVREMGGNYSHQKILLHCIDRGQMDRVINRINHDFVGKTHVVFAINGNDNIVFENLNCTAAISSDSFKNYLKEENIKFELI